jgi:hypothetical protein
MSGLLIKDIEDALYALVKDEVPDTDGWQVVWGNQNAPAPSKQIELRRGSPFIVKLGRDIQGPVSTSTLAAPRIGTREILFSIRGYSKGAIQILEDLRSRLDDDDVADLLLASAIALVEIGPIQNITQLYASQMKEVGTFDLRIRTHSLREGQDAEPDVGYIQAVEIERTSRDPSSTVDQIEIGEPA